MASVATKAPHGVEGSVGSNASSDRRRAPRRSLRLGVVERTNGALYFQETENVSTTGVHLGATLAHPPGTRVSLAMKLPGSASELAVEGEVVARHPEEVGMAIQFIALTDRERSAIEALVRAYER